MDLSTAIVSIITINLIAWATPGPNMLAVASASVQHGRAIGVATGLGLACSALLWSALAVAGASVLFNALPNLVFTLKLAGAIYLVWLGMRSMKAAISGIPVLGTGIDGGDRIACAFRTGFFVGITNPKALVFFGAVMTSFIPAAAPSWFLVLVVMLCGALGVLLHFVTATVFSTRAAMRAVSEGRRAISVTIGLLFCGFGAKVAYDAVRGSFSSAS